PDQFGPFASPNMPFSVCAAACILVMGEGPELAQPLISQPRVFLAQPRMRNVTPQLRVAFWRRVEREGGGVVNWAARTSLHVAATAMQHNAIQAPRAEGKRSAAAGNYLVGARIRRG